MCSCWLGAAAASILSQNLELQGFFREVERERWWAIDRERERERVRKIMRDRQRKIKSEIDFFIEKLIN